MKRTISAYFSLGLLGALSSGCTVNEPCDPEQTVVYGQCQDPPEETGDGDGDATTDSAGEGGTTSGGDGDSDGGAGGEGGQLSTPDEELPNFGAACSEHSTCTGGTICGADGGLPSCIGLCGEGDPFEASCPEGTTCTMAQPGTSVCL
jgi:hypothetical protein